MRSETAGLPHLRALNIHVHARDGHYTLSLEGELDLQSENELREVVDELPDPSAIVLDLRKLSFLDSRGLRVILSVQQRCEDNGIKFALTPGREQTQRLFAITGLLEVLPFADAGTAQSDGRQTAA
jgi:anti-sigma B factor antagonist/stage II sporulation protein AA (anti-sigma F factor antagonist)